MARTSKQPFGEFQLKRIIDIGDRTFDDDGGAIGIQNGRPGKK